jgi:hypothetical protein
MSLGESLQEQSDRAVAGYLAEQHKAVAMMSRMCHGWEPYRHRQAAFNGGMSWMLECKQKISAELIGVSTITETMFDA